MQGIGIDIMEIDRMEEILSRSGDAFLRRVFTPQEIKTACSGENPAQFFASAFAVKEAVFKALTMDWSSGINLQDIEIFRGTLGEPLVRLSGAVEEHKVKKGVCSVQISITYGNRCAFATALAL